MLVACQEGHLEVAMLLSSYGASRDVNVLSGAELLAERGGHADLLRWLRESRQYAPLFHVLALYLNVQLFQSCVEGGLWEGGKGQVQ